MVRVMVFIATFNNTSVISWWSVLLVEEIGVSRENHLPIASYCKTLSHHAVSSTPRLSGIRTHSVSGDRYSTGVDPGGRTRLRASPKIGKNMIFWRKIVIFHTKYPKTFRASLRSVQFF